jgi:hypothetical protein
MVPVFRTRPVGRHGRRTLRLAAASSLLVLTAACGAGREPAAQPAAQLLSSAAPRSTRCVVEQATTALPAADAVVDSAALVEAVRALRSGDAPPTGHVLLTLAFDRDGANVRRDVLEHSTRPIIADSVQRLVFASRREVDAGESEWGVRLRVELGAAPELRVGRRLYCPPVPRDQRVESMMQGIHPIGSRFRRGVRERTVLVRAQVDEMGIVGSARIERGELSGSAMELEITNYLRQFFFSPATLDDVPTVSYVMIPVRIRG